MVATEHKRTREIDLSFKQVRMTCNCGNKICKTVLVINGFGFDDVKCNKCGKRHFITAEGTEGC